MRVDQFRELGKDFHYLVRTLAAGGNDYDICLSLFGDSVLKHGLSGSERSRDKSCTTFYDRIYRIDRTDTRFEQLIRTWFFFVTGDGTFYRPALYHRHLHIFAGFVRQDGYHLSYCILSCFFQALDRIFSFEGKRNHDLVRLEIFVHFTQPATSSHLVTHFGKRFEIPQLIIVQRERIFSTPEENAFHLIEVVLQTIVVA